MLSFYQAATSVLRLNTTSALLPVTQMIGRAFGEADLLQLAHVYEQTAGVTAGVQPSVFAQQQA